MEPRRGRPLGAMEGNMAITSTAIFFVLPLILLLGMLLAMELGRRLGEWKRNRERDNGPTGLGTIEAALFGMLGLIIAFTFNGAASRFDNRRGLIVEESNAIGTAWMRLDMLPERFQDEVRDLFRRYLDLRLETYRLLPNIPAAEASWAESLAVQREIWKLATEACHTDEAKGYAMVVLPALNSMFDIANTRILVMLYQHPPHILFVMLFVLCLVCSVLAGYGMASSKSRSWLHMIGFALITAVVVYVILDLEYPRLGFIQVKTEDRALIDLRNSMD